MKTANSASRPAVLDILGRCLKLVEFMEGRQEPSHIRNLKHRRRQFETCTVSARNIEVARDSLNEEDGDSRPRAIVGLIAEAVAVHEGHGFDGAHHTGDLVNLLHRDTGDFGSPLGGKLLNVLSQLIETVNPVLAEVVIVEILADDHMQDGQSQRAVGARANGNPDIRMSAQRVEHRADVDGNHAAVTLIETVGVLAAGLINAGVLLVVPPADQQVGLVNLARERGSAADGTGLGGFSLIPADAVVTPVR